MAVAIWLGNLCIDEQMQGYSKLIFFTDAAVENAIESNEKSVVPNDEETLGKNKYYFPISFFFAS